MLLDANDGGDGNTVTGEDCHSDRYCVSDGNVDIDGDGNDNIVIGDNGRGFCSVPCLYQRWVRP